ncbi:putative secreted protein (Por secretion system target) [Flavobacteriaceae bacterium MAR_2010_72]|nr:putative secreted protein (Por secretion system target) [Flavobacteriaceae bacterium MAR_2010_72]TVZ58317.1 putative secreted protein (Por secretion system target) [Flavobacteriaceae bacterium MAR_2010_105]
MKLIMLVLLFPILLCGQTKIGQDIDGELVNDYFGYSVSLSADGSIVAVGAYANDGNGNDSGHVRVFQNQSGSWTQIGQDIDGESAGDLSGYSVSLSADGSIVAIGATNNSGGGDGSGHVRVYQNQSGTWTQLGQDINGSASYTLSGWSVSLSDDGSFLAIGAIGFSGPGEFLGRVRVYENQAGTWTQVGQDLKGEANFDFSGWSTSLSADGSILAVGATYNDDSGEDSGHVKVYENQAGTWVQIGDNINGENPGDQSGYSVSLSNDGSIVAISATYNDGSGTNSGHVRVYENQLGVWTQIGQDVDGEVANDQSGQGISLSADGTILAVGAYSNSINGSSSGVVKVYKYISGVWTQIGVSIGGEAANDWSGWSVNMSYDGSTVAIGAPNNDGNGSNSGQVRVYDLNSVLSTKQFEISNFTVYPNPATTRVTVKMNDSEVLRNINLYNQVGQLLVSTNEKYINTSDLASGIYHLEVITETGKASKKIVIK